MVPVLKPVGKLMTSKYLRARQNQGIAWSTDSNLSRYCTVLGLKPVGKLVTSKYLSVRQNQVITWSSDSNLWGN